MLLCLLVTACQTTGSGGTKPIDVNKLPKSIPCSALDPIRWSKNDTRLTQEQVTEYNGVYKEICLK